MEVMVEDLSWWFTNIFYFSLVILVCIMMKFRREE